MSVAAILGSGFGLYGYLPAIIEAGSDRIVLPKRYRAKFSTRPELSRFADAIEWVLDENAALERADWVIAALSPELQMRWLSHCRQLPNVERLVLEKPLAPTPGAAASLFATEEFAIQMVTISRWILPVTSAAFVRTSMLTSLRTPNSGK